MRTPVKKFKKTPGWMGFSKRVTESSNTYSKDVNSNNQGLGRFFGTGVRAKLGKSRTGTGITGNPVSKRLLKRPPRSVV